MRPDEGKWYPDEAICARRQYKALPWLKTQRKIQRRAKERNRYFTQKMLAEIRAVREGIRGAGPDRTRRGAEWPAGIGTLEQLDVPYLQAVEGLRTWQNRF